MRKIFVAGLLLLLLNALSACGQKGEVSELTSKSVPNFELATELIVEPILHLHISQHEGQKYKVIKKMEDAEKVRKVLAILLNMPYTDAKVLMNREPDYKMKMVNFEPNIKYRPTTYAIWVIPDKNVVEVVIEDQHKYGKVPEGNAKFILEILGERIVEQ